MPTSRITTAFATARPRALLVPYLTAGFPSLSDTPALMAALEAGGADLIELGVPFSDPFADGPVIQRANEQALANDASLGTALDAAASYRDRGGTLPVVLMGYANPFLRMGTAKLAKRCQASAVDGILAVDWPATVGDELGQELAAAAIDRILLIAPTTTAARVEEIDAAASGYLYYVSLKGVTGAAMPDLNKTAAAGKELRACTKLPLAVGFGVREPADCAKLGQAFDAIVVGSRIVAAAGEAGSSKAAENLRTLTAALREALS